MGKGTQLPGGIVRPRRREGLVSHVRHAMPFRKTVPPLTERPPKIVGAGELRFAVVRVSLDDDARSFSDRAEDHSRQRGASHPCNSRRPGDRKDLSRSTDHRNGFEERQEIGRDRDRFLPPKRLVDVRFVEGALRLARVGLVDFRRDGDQSMTLAPCQSSFRLTQVAKRINESRANGFAGRRGFRSSPQGRERERG